MLRAALMAIALTACASTAVPSQHVVDGRVVHCVGDQDGDFYWLERCDDGTTIRTGFTERK